MEQKYSLFYPMKRILFAINKNPMTLSTWFSTWKLKCNGVRAVEACKGMVYLEETGVVHRDIAARNLLGTQLVQVENLAET